MAPAPALVSVVLLSQIATGMAATSPFTVELPCSSYTNGCTCDAVGMAENTSAADVIYEHDRDGTCCQWITPTKNCREWLGTDATGCPTTKMVNIGALKTAAGATPETTCCSVKPTVTCADVTCTTRRRSAAAMWKAKANVGTTACTSENDCEEKCCEKENNCLFKSRQYSFGSNGSYSCGSDKMEKPTESSTCSAGTYTQSYTATASLKVTSEAEYQTSCCQAKPSCPASPSCPSNMMKDNSATTYMQSETECCTYKNTSCMMAGCSGMPMMQGGDGCGVGAIVVCTSSICDANQVLDTTKVHAIGDDTAAVKTACCVAKSTATTQGQKCKDWIAAANAEAAAATGAGTASDAHINGASLAVLVFGAFVLKLGL